MISKDLEKIRLRGLSKDVYADELPIGWHKYLVDDKHRRVEKKAFQSSNREHKINCYMEE